MGKESKLTKNKAFAKKTDKQLREIVVLDEVPVDEFPESPMYNQVHDSQFDQIEEEEEETDEENEELANVLFGQAEEILTREEEKEAYRELLNDLQEANKYIGFLEQEVHVHEDNEESHMVRIKELVELNMIKSNRLQELESIIKQSSKEEEEELKVIKEIKEQIKKLQ